MKLFLLLLLLPCCIGWQQLSINGKLHNYSNTLTTATTLSPMVIHWTTNISAGTINIAVQAQTYGAWVGFGFGQQMIGSYAVAGWKTSNYSYVGAFNLSDETTVGVFPCTDPSIISMDVDIVDNGWTTVQFLRSLSAPAPWASIDTMTDTSVLLAFSMTDIPAFGSTELYQHDVDLVTSITFATSTNGASANNKFWPVLSLCVFYFLGSIFLN